MRLYPRSSAIDRNAALQAVKANVPGLDPEPIHCAVVSFTHMSNKPFSQRLIPVHLIVFECYYP
jgi:hypothetical protein